MYRPTLLVGSVGAGKTTLRQRLLGEEIEYAKTQAMDVVGNIVDTPGEYLDHGRLNRALTISAYDVEIVVLVLDPTADNSRFNPGYAAALNRRTVGVVTKRDVATVAQLADARENLVRAGAERVIVVSGVTGQGINELKEALCSTST
ncbi:EutP/PduV family microcompartment system protein [Tessaracoccus sp. OH4464_COT-324]|uniref:EutP/PduV family microcompartment system protein n=1 Tax=Tessaracoccus sp. OH4464_COT-324 TaxID=2491059 RepID=UPI000F644BE3|nr:EutP/PduV family microcompartment system protein [Tessaracoccus sp. OH4464_COT-324]RRD47808.1 ethanolamine utilization protein EutP [Tessaracoccus sp. OH4464_COT-324]